MPGLITIRELNSIGRFGNKCFLYVFSKAYARAHGAQLLVPYWEGCKLFINATEELITDKTPILPQTECDNVTKRPLNRWFGKVDLDIRVFAQSQCYIDYMTRPMCREFLKLKDTWELYSPSAQGKPPYSAMHIRRGDYVTPEFRDRYCEVSEDSYKRAIKEFDIPKPVIRVSEEMSQPPDNWPDPQLAWLPDFLLLRDAAHLLRANSSFSWWASVLGYGKTYSPVVGKLVGLQDVPFIESNSPTTAGVFSNQSDLNLKEE